MIDYDNVWWLFQAASSYIQCYVYCGAFGPYGLRRMREKDTKSYLEIGWQGFCLYNITIRSGVDSLEINMDRQKVTVTGYVDKRRVLKLVRRTGRKAEFWPFPYDSEYYPYASQYLDESNFTSSYNYYTHGYNESMRGYFPHLPYQTIDDRITYSFNEENVHACMIM